MKIFPQALLPLLIGIGGGSITTASASITASSAASDTDTGTDIDVIKAIDDSPPQQQPAQTERMLRKKHKPKSEKDPPPPTNWWLSNLPNPGQCNATEAIAITCPADRAWGYFLTCFDNPNRAQFLKSIRFWTAAPYGVGVGIGNRISVYYGSKTFGPYTTGVEVPYSMFNFDVPAPDATQSTYIAGLNTITLSGPGGLLYARGSSEQALQEGFCIGITPAFRIPSDPLCDYPVRYNSRTYCPDPGLQVLATGSGEGSYINCNDGGTENPAQGFGPNPTVNPALPLPGFCMEAQVSDTTDDAVKVTWNIQYGSAYNNLTNVEEGLFLDKYEPRDDPSDQKPIAIIVHGGGCSTGSRKDSTYVELATYFAKNGFVALSVGYRLQSYWPSCRTPGSIQAAGSDIKASIRYVKEQSAAWGTDSSKIWLYGCSAGARASAWATYVPGNGLKEELGDPNAPLVKTSKNSPEYDAKVTYLTMFSGEMYIPHLDCDLYACYTDAPECIEPNAPVPGWENVAPYINCAYAYGPFGPPYPVPGFVEHLCNPERSIGCLNVLSNASTPLTMIHNNPDNLKGTFTPWQVALRLQALAESKGVSVELIRNTVFPGHCSPRYPFYNLLQIARKGLGIETDTDEAIE